MMPKNNKELQRFSTERAQRRRRVRSIMLMVMALAVTLLVMLSLPAVQQALFPDWLIRSWGRVVAAIMIAVIGAVVILPVVVEANMNPRTLSGPGDAPIVPEDIMSHD